MVCLCARAHPLISRIRDLVQQSSAVQNYSVYGESTGLPKASFLHTWKLPGIHASNLICRAPGFNYELLDVEGGSKLALIYRLVQRSAGPLPVFQDNRDAVYTILQAAQEWEAEKLLPKRAIHMLDNE